jgi:hypothetical protein
MSKRLLIFNERYVPFFYRSGAMREDLSHSSGGDANQFSEWRGLPTSPFTNEYYQSQFKMARYCDLVSLYSSRNMTDKIDALPAVSGLLNIWSRSSNLDFVAGLPSAHLTDTLIWYGSEYSSRGNPELPS